MDSSPSLAARQPDHSHNPVQAEKDGVEVVCELAGEPREEVEKIQRAIMTLQLQQADLGKKVTAAKKPVTKFKTQSTKFHKSLEKLEFQLQTSRGKRKPCNSRRSVHSCQQLAA